MASDAVMYSLIFDTFNLLGGEQSGEASGG